MVFAIPPLAEQKVIAEKLDAAGAGKASAKARLEQITNPETFSPISDGAAVSGQLTRTS